MFVSFGLFSRHFSELNQLTEGSAECQSQCEGNCGHEGLAAEQEQKEERNCSNNKLWDDDIEESMLGTLRWRIIEMSFSRILENLSESKRILKLHAQTTTELEVPYQQEKCGETLGNKSIVLAVLSLSCLSTKQAQRSIKHKPDKN